MCVHSTYTMHIQVHQVIIQVYISGYYSGNDIHMSLRQPPVDKITILPIKKAIIIINSGKIV